MIYCTISINSHVPQFYFRQMASNTSNMWFHPGPAPPVLVHWFAHRNILLAVQFILKPCKAWHPECGTSIKFYVNNIGLNINTAPHIIVNIIHLNIKPPLHVGVNIICLNIKPCPSCGVNIIHLNVKHHPSHQLYWY